MQTLDTRLLETLKRAKINLTDEQIKAVQVLLEREKETSWHLGYGMAAKLRNRIAQKVTKWRQNIEKDCVQFSKELNLNLEQTNKLFRFTIRQAKNNFMEGSRSGIDIIKDLKNFE